MGTRDPPTPNGSPKRLGHRPPCAGASVCSRLTPGTVYATPEPGPKAGRNQNRFINKHLPPSLATPAPLPFPRSANCLERQEHRAVEVPSETTPGCTDPILNGPGCQAEQRSRAQVQSRGRKACPPRPSREPAEFRAPEEDPRRTSCLLRQRAI